MKKLLFLLPLTIMLATNASTSFADRDHHRHRQHHRHDHDYGHDHSYGYYPKERVYYRKTVRYYPRPMPRYYPQPAPGYYPQPEHEYYQRPEPRYYQQPQSYYQDPRSHQGLAGGVIGSVFGYQIGNGDPVAAGLGAAAGSFIGNGMRDR